MRGVSMGFVVTLILVSSFEWACAQAAPTAKPALQVREFIGINYVTIRYDAADAQGESVWGDRVPYDEPWIGSGGLPATIDLNESIVVGGEPIARGTYNLRIVPGASEWTIQFWPQTPPGGAAPESPALTPTVKPTVVPHEDQLSYSFETLADDRIELIVGWGDRTARLLMALATPLPQFEGETQEIFLLAREVWRRFFELDFDAMLEHFAEDFVFDQGGGKAEYLGYMRSANEVGAFDDIAMDLSGLTVEVMGDDAAIEGSVLDGPFGVLTLEATAKRRDGEWQVVSLVQY